MLWHLTSVGIHPKPVSSSHPKNAVEERINLPTKGTVLEGNNHFIFLYFANTMQTLNGEAEEFLVLLEVY